MGSGARRSCGHIFKNDGLGPLLPPLSLHGPPLRKRPEARKYSFSQRRLPHFRSLSKPLSGLLKERWPLTQIFWAMEEHNRGEEKKHRHSTCSFA